MKNCIRFFLIPLLILGPAWLAHTQVEDQDVQSAIEGPIYDWPREFFGPNGEKLEIHQPQIIEWDNYQRIEAISAVAFYLTEEASPSLGVIKFSARTDADLDNQEVLLAGFELRSSKFSDLDEATSQKISAEIEKILAHEKAVIISMDRIIAGLPANQPKTRSLESQINLEAPPIFISEDLAYLVMLDGEPILQQIEDSDLTFAVNTNWDLFYKKENETFYILVEDLWLETQDLKGDWKVAENLPEDFSALPDDDNWAAVRENLEGGKPEGDIPSLFVSYQPAELILFEGEPLLESIEGTQLMWATNTDSDILFSLETNNYYFLVSGRWFRTPDLNSGNWTFATPEMPGDFALIPADHPRGRVRVAVAGTPEADEAILLAGVPQKAKIKRSEAKIDVTYSGEPEFEAIVGTEMSYAVNTASSVIKVRDNYLAVEDGVWFTSKSPTGPWEVSTEVPDEIYTIPANSPVHNTTYVYVYSHTTEYVYTGYTSGYWGVYVGFGAVMYGAGWYHSPYYYYNPFRPYYPYYYGHWASYGYRSYYNPHTGTYGRGGFVYGPYGGYGAGARYNPSTGAYARGAVAYGNGWAEGWAQAYNPSTGRGAMTYQGANSYSNWGTSAVRGDNGWVQTAHYRDADQGAFGYRTSEGGVGGIAYKDGNVYAGRDGNVYRRDESGNWQKNDGGSWNNVDVPSRDSIDGSQARQNVENRNLDRNTVQTRQTPATRESAGGGIQTPANRTSPGGGIQNTVSRDSTGGGIMSNRQNSGSWTRPNSSNTNRQLNRDSMSRSQGNRQTRSRQDWKKTGKYKGYGQNRQRTRQRSGGRRR